MNRFTAILAIVAILQFPSGVANAETTFAPCHGVTITLNDDSTWTVATQGVRYEYGSDYTLEMLTAQYCN